MIDIKFFRENKDIVKKAIENKGIKNFNFELLVSLDEQRLVLLKKIEDIRARRNYISTEIPNANSEKKQELLKEAGEIKNSLKELEEKYGEVESSFKEMFLLVPNIPSAKMPVGQGDGDNVVVKGWSKTNGEVLNPTLEDNTFVDRKNIAYLDHLELGKLHDIIDVEKSAEVSGSRFAYLKKEAVMLQDAISNLMKKELQRRGFMPIIPPLLVKETALYGTSHFPEGKEQVYKINNENVEEGQELYLVGSSEPTNFSYFSNTTFDKEELPIKFYAQTPCFRSEVGSWGRDVRGIKRVHQFDKLEMNAISTKEKADEIFNEFLEINEWLLQKLELPYRVVNKCTGDSGYNASYFQYDLEVYRNATNEWMETMTATNTSDFQSRRLNIRYKNVEETTFAYTLNDTGVAFGRVILALLEHHQDGQGNILIPEALIEFFGKDRIAKN